MDYRPKKEIEKMKRLKGMNKVQQSDAEVQFNYFIPVSGL